MRIPAILLALVPTALFAQNSRLDTSDGEPRIVVTATKTGRAVPDKVTMYVTVEGSGETTSGAVQRANEKLQSVTAAIRSLSAPDGIQSMPYGVSPAPNVNGYPGAPTQTSYVSRYVIRVQPKSIDQITALASAAIAAGASMATPPTFEALSADSVRRVRYTEALAQARRDAEVLAAALGGRLGSIIEVSSSGTPNQVFGQPSFSFRSYEYMGPAPSPDVIVAATVTVRYRFVQQ
jgi:uncharacterized protein YggE